MVEFTHVEYTNKNQDIENNLKNLSIEHREVEQDLFNIKLKQEVTVVPLRDYIQNWLHNSFPRFPGYQ